MLRNIIGGIIIFIGISFFVFGNIILNHNLYKLENDEKNEKIKKLEYEIGYQKEKTSYIIGFLAIIIGILIIILL